MRRRGEDAALAMSLTRLAAWGNPEQFEKVMRALTE
jgi:hypothetical protein